MDLPPAPTPPVNSGGMPSNADRTANLLNLLKFSGGSGSSSSQQQQQQHQHPAQQQQQLHHQHHHAQQHQSEHHQHVQQPHYQQHQPRQPSYSQAQYSSPPTRILQPAPAGADPTGLLAALMRGAHEADEETRQSAAATVAAAAAAPVSSAPEHAQHAQPANTNPFANGSPSADTRSYLLNLLNRPKPSQTDQAMLTETSRSNGAASQSPEITTDSSRFFHQYQQQQPQQQPQQQSQQQQQQIQPNAYQPQTQQHIQQQYPQRQSSESYSESYHQTSNPPSYSYQHQQSQDSPDVSALFQQLMGSLAQSSPQSYTSQPAANAANTAQPPFQILKKEQASPAGSQARAGSERSPLASPPEQSRHTANRTSSLHSHPSARHSAKQTPPTEFDSYISVDKNKETVAEAVNDLADQADRDAQEALDRAEHDLATTDAVDDAVRQESSSGQEWPGDAVHAAIVQSVEKQIVQGIKDGIDKDEAYHNAETSFINDASDSGNVTGENVRGVADSWESADLEETIEVEEKELPQVRVYKFPQEPWNSISLKEEIEETRPEFRDESIMDIARLKKEFDQIDRNLFTASQTYMTYGMSKQGGLRVIRQDDGKDAKVFTDTKDRIFNVAMSVTPPESGSVHREAIIGTGVGGAVYWVQIKDGEKDHIEDPHLEQYGFALPPISSPDGDAPGGLLKTRARASTAHPEFFAVGRGKSINFIWPAYILQNKLFKTGHDRVVDTEALLTQCSLKINTGKAGKDFTFSQDDSVVVSLDKSGRVKFWDVRSLTKVKEDSDYRYPLPAESSLEVKEPLMTLATTPDGEKAWPTSVLLLDRKKAYEQRGPLRYMVVGMKQNHTLQVWDLALGKAVQEFNLPHSKESDAVCSVMYHPASGMIVIGHPTRNSVYFAHFSAPKYSLENVSQVDYIEKLLQPLKPNEVCPIRKPSSTAIISGFREYSFANRGVLRSLDILYTPITKQASAQAGGHDAKDKDRTRFELYAMHSKGVACVLVKKSDLGGSENTLVLDAVKEGLVAVSDFNKPTAVDPSHGGNQVAKNAATRAPVKTSPSQQSTSAAQSDTTQRGSEAATPVKPKNEPKEAETPVQSSKEGQAEKPERKSRKKKGNAAAKEAEAAANGAANLPRAQHTGKAEKAETALAKTNTASAVTSGVTAESFDSAISTMQARLTVAVSDTLKSSLKNLQGKIDEGARARDENFNQHQLKLLDMVSEVLNENTQKVLESLIHHQFTELLVPAIGDKATKAVSDVLQHKLQPNVASAVQKEIQNALPQALNRSLRSADFATTIAERVGTSVNSTVQQEIVATLSQRLTPTFRNIAAQSAQQAAAEVHQQYNDKLEQMQSQHAADTGKIDQLLSYVTRLTDMVSTMAATQSSLQAEFLKLKQQPVHELPGASGAQGPSRDGDHGPQGTGHYGRYPNNGMQPGPNVPSSIGSFQQPQPRGHHHQQQQYAGSPEYMRSGPTMGSPQGAPSDMTFATKNTGAASGFAHPNNEPTSVDQKIHDIEEAIKDGELQLAMFRWIEGLHQQEVFQRCLSLYPPSRFERLPLLLLLAVTATISNGLSVNNRLKQQIDWIEMAVRSFDQRVTGPEWDKQGPPEVLQHAAATMHRLIDQLVPLIAGYDSGYPVDPWLANVERSKMEGVIRSSEHVLQSLEVLRATS